ncbi:hypothetical protein BMT54_10985 [Pasteurellaceae bacterium 15-036681]|nr:hypothetical protein BMT54_10985 [Pasteurellaceae bacterium 15-036681]
MSMKKVTLASLILLSLTACSSGGGSSNGTMNTSEPKATQSEQVKSLSAELEKAKVDLEQKNKELEKVQQEQQQNLTKLNNELIAAKNAANKANSDLAEAKQALAKTKADSKATASELATAKANLANAQQAQQDAEQALAKTEADSKATASELATAKVNLANAQQAQQDAERALAKTEADSKATASELATAKANLANAQQAQQEAEQALAGKTQVINEINKQAKLALEHSGMRGFSIPNVYADGFFDTLQIGLNTIPVLTVTADESDGIISSNHYIYKQNYSHIYSRNNVAFSPSDEPWAGSFRIDRIDGQRTETLPATGNATYTGKAFNTDITGDLNYTVNFTDKMGSGSIRGLADLAEIQLQKGSILSNSIQADAAMQDGTKGKYSLEFFGPNAEEIAGKAYMYKQFSSTVKTNGTTANEYNDPERGTIFGLAAERGEISNK